MKIVFIGFGGNGEKCLLILLKSKFNILKVLVPKDHDTKGMFKIAQKHKLPIVEIFDHQEQLENEIKNSLPDLLVIASFPKIISKNIFNIPKYGTINVHTGALPRYRGYHPINWAIIKDEKVAGVTIHYLDEGMDSGDILAQKLIPILNSDNINSLKDKLTTAGSSLMIDVVKKIAQKKQKITGLKQNHNEATYAPKRNPEDGKIDWNSNSRDIFNLIRALKSPYPNAFTYNSKKEKIEFNSSYLPKIKGKVIGKIKGQYLITTEDGVILVKPAKKLNIGEILK